MGLSFRQHIPASVAAELLFIELNIECPLLAAG
jgi:hypothetical protein